MPKTDAPRVRLRARWQARDSALAALGYSTYNAYLRSSHWAQLKARYRASDLPQTCLCGEADNLQFHHLTYERVGQEELTDIRPLCERCHASVHVLDRRGDLEGAAGGLALAGFASEERAAEYDDQRQPARQRAADVDAVRRIRRDVGLGKMRAHNVKDYTKRAANAGIDVSDELALIDRVLEAMAAKLER